MFVGSKKRDKRILQFIDIYINLPHLDGIQEVEKSYFT